MQRIILRELSFDDEIIVFNAGENYIVGSNGMGKTTLFYIIQYILGIKRTLPMKSTPLGGRTLSLRASFGDRLINITRNLGSGDIDFEGDINANIRVSSSELGDIYHELLQPNISKDEDRMVAIEILKVAFQGEQNSYISKRESNLFNKILGINVELPNQIKREIMNFREEIKLEEAVSNGIKKYIDRVKKAMKNEGTGELGSKDVRYIVNILEGEFTNMCNESLKNILLVEDAEDSLCKVKSSNEDRIKERIKIIQSYFYKLVDNFGLFKDVSIEDAFNNKMSSELSMGQRAVLRILALITICRVSENEWHNASGLMVTDGIDSMFDKDIGDRCRKIISMECDAGVLQYIEFSRYKETIPREAVILDLDKGRWWNEIRF